MTQSKQQTLFGEPESLASLDRAPEPPRPARLGGASIEYKPARDTLTRATGFMDAYDFTLNPYAGCAFGCTYCYAAFFSRGSDSATGAERRDTWGSGLKSRRTRWNCSGGAGRAWTASGST